MGSQTEDTFRILPKKLFSLTLHFLDGLFTVFINLRISPDVLTIFALAAGIAAGILFVIEQPFWAGISIVICGLFDIIDGKVAASTNRKSLFGAIFDSTLDRYSEFFIYLGLAYHFRNHWALWATFFALLGSNMVSYTRARSEGLGIECTVGIMQRAERMVLLFSAAILGPIFKIFNPLMTAALVITAVLSNLTAIQRTFYVRKIEKQRKSRKEA